MIKTLAKQIKEFKLVSILTPIAMLAEVIVENFIPLLMATIIDSIGSGDLNSIYRTACIMVVLAIAGLISGYLGGVFGANASAGFARNLRKAMFENIQTFSFSNIDKFSTAGLVTRLTTDVTNMQNAYQMILRMAVRAPFSLIVAMIMAFTVDTKAALVFVVTIPLLSVVVFGIMLVTMPLYKKVQSNLDSVLLATRENLTGARVIRAFNKEEDEIQRYEEENQTLTDAQKFVGRISGLMNPLTYMIVNGAIIVLIYIGAMRVNIGDLTQGQVVALLNYMSQILIELVKLANLIISVTKAVACGNRIESILDEKPSMESGKLLWNDGVNVDNPAVPAVEFDHVSLTYKGAAGESLSDITFSAKAGQTIGIIGGTGSGKSSLVNMIPRCYDATKGEIKIFGKNIKEYDTGNLRDHIGMVLQKAVLFKGTIADNLRWGKEDATEEEMDEALMISQAKEFVDNKVGRLEFGIEQGGRNLSGGQKQRLTIARALVRRPEILILDDSASALDFATDAALRMAIHDMKENPTVFIVSQRASSIQYADQIIVLDDGAVAGIGTHEELLAGCPVYQEIYYSQFPKEEVANG